MGLVRRLLLVIVGFYSTIFAAQVQSQIPPRFGLPQLHRWDTAHGILFMGRNLVLQKTSPPLRAYNEDGLRYGSDINLFKDFPDVEKVVVDDFAAAPAGATLIAATLIYGRRSVKQVLLTYDTAGELRQVVDTAPYSAEAITSDDQGNVYLLGERTDERETDPPYPLLIKYDSSGNIVGRAIDSDIFKSGSSAIEDFGPGYEIVRASVMVNDGKLYLYAPSERQVLVCSQEGKILRRAALENVAGKIASADGVSRAAISEVAFVDENHVVLYLTEYIRPGEPGVEDYTNMHTAIYLVDLTTKSFKLILRGEPDADPVFLGTRGRQLFTLTMGDKGSEIQTHDLF